MKPKTPRLRVLIQDSTGTRYLIKTIVGNKPLLPASTVAHPACIPMTLPGFKRYIVYDPDSIEPHFTVCALGHEQARELVARACLTKLTADDLYSMAMIPDPSDVDPRDEPPAAKKVKLPVPIRVEIDDLDFDSPVTLDVLCAKLAELRAKYPPGGYLLFDAGANNISCTFTPSDQ